MAAAIENALGPDDAGELLLVCDLCDERTEAEVEAWLARTDLPFTVRAERTSLGESGAARNAGVRAAAGDFVAFVDGDDLISPRYLVDALRVLAAATSPTIVHPQYVVSFGARSLLWETESTRSGKVSYRDLVRHNLWPSSSVAPRAVYLDNPYRSLAPESGYGPEDWVWNIDTVVAGIDHEVVPGAVFFYRVRESGGVNNRHAMSLLPSFDLPALKRRLPLPPAGADSSEDLQPRPGLGRRAYAAALPAVRWSTGFLSFEVKHAMYRAARGAYRAVTRSGAHEDHAELSPAVLEALRAASEVDPAVSWTAFEFQKLPVWHSRDDGFTEVLEKIVDDLRDASAVVAVPWVGIGGADIVSLNYARALQASERFAGKTAFLATYLPERTVHEQIPGTIRYVQIWDRWLDFPPEMQRKVLAQAMILVRPELVVSVNCFHLTNALRSYDRQVLDGTSVYATLFAFDRIGAGFPVNPITDDSHRSYLDRIDGLITDNTATARLIDDILAVPRERVLVQRQPALTTTDPLRIGTRAYNNSYFSEKNPFRLVWPHRLDEEKRPDALVAIARALRARGLPVSIDVWGQRVLTKDGDSLMSDLAAAGVTYRGPYSGGLPGLPTWDYHALLLTSQSEGLPLVLVQSLLYGLPVVASGVGGVGDIILDRETGLLTQGPDDVDGFVSAIEELYESLSLRRHIIERGYRFAVENHSWQAFQRRVQETIVDRTPASAQTAVL